VDRADVQPLTGKQRRQNANATPPKGYPASSGSYADPSNKKYPIDTAERVRAAWSYINMPKNRRQYSAAELAAIERRIRVAAKKFGVEISG
jgi:hypothetical protein